MAVPGAEFTSKYGHKTEEDMKEKVDVEANKLKEKVDTDKDLYYYLPNQLYEKYESPVVASGLEGGALSSGSVSGTALQDPPTQHAAHTWQQLFNAGLYGTTVQQTAGGGTGGDGVLAGRPRVSRSVCLHLCVCV